MKVDDKYLQRLGVLPYKSSRHPNTSRWVRTQFPPARGTRLRTLTEGGRWAVRTPEGLPTQHGLDVEAALTEQLIEEMVIENPVEEHPSPILEATIENILNEYPAEPDFPANETEENPSLDSFMQWLRRMRGNRDNRT